jgi:nucleoside-diphosphate-sugar epimerase
VDCTDLGQLVDALSGVDAFGGRPDVVLHLAGIPAPGLAPDVTSFETNARSTYNVLTACVRLGISRVVWASSETIHGLPFATPPDFVPIDETHPGRPEWHYSLSKQVGETIADAFVRWHPELSVVSMRFSNVYAAADYVGLPEIQADPELRTSNLWAYIDVDDAAAACHPACEAPTSGHHRLVVAAADTLMATPTADLMRDHFPGVPTRGDLDGFASLLSSARAGEVLGYRPALSWRDRIHG